LRFAVSDLAEDTRIEKSPRKLHGTDESLLHEFKEAVVDEWIRHGRRSGIHITGHGDGVHGGSRMKRLIPRRPSRHLVLDIRFVGIA
jgi:hypothetical protein